MVKGDRSWWIMRIARELAELTKGTDRKTAAGIISCVAECALGYYDTAAMMQTAQEDVE